MAADLDLKSERGMGGHRGPQRKSFVLPIRVNRVPTGWLGDACLLWEGKGRIRERMKNWITISNDFIRRNRMDRYRDCNCSDFDKIGIIVVDNYE